MNDLIKPQARDRELVIHELPDEMLVYDLAAHKAYCLNRSAAIIWNLCDGNHTTAEMAGHLATALNAAENEEVVRLALDELEKCELLQTPIKNDKNAVVERRISRRELTRRLGIAAAFSLPFISILIAPTAAQSASLKSNGVSCGLSEECASGCCDPVASVCAVVEVCGARGIRRGTDKTITINKSR